MNTHQNRSLHHTVGTRVKQNARAALFWTFIISALIFSAIQPARSASLQEESAQSRLKDPLVELRQNYERGIDPLDEIEREYREKDIRLETLSRPPARESLTNQEGQKTSLGVSSLPSDQTGTPIYNDDEYTAEVARLIKMQHLGLPLVSEKFPDLARSMTEEGRVAGATDTLRDLYTNTDVTRQPTPQRHTVTPSEDGMILATVTVIFLFPVMFLLLLLIFSVLPQNTARHSRASIFYRRLRLPDEIVSLARVTGIVVTIGSALRLILLVGGAAFMGITLPTIALVLLLPTLAALTLGALTWARRTPNHAIPLAMISTFLLCADLYVKTTVGQNAGVMLFSILAVYITVRHVLSARCQSV